MDYPTPSLPVHFFFCFSSLSPSPSLALSACSLCSSFEGRLQESRIFCKLESFEQRLTDEQPRRQGDMPLSLSLTSSSNTRIVDDLFAGICWMTDIQQPGEHLKRLRPSPRWHGNFPCPARAFQECELARNERITTSKPE